ncbi:glycosyltransferase family 4 protein [Hydrogenophaga sp. SL48]|jgi:glycosyltransferase involved in cell wall biosynthesis|uniref:glycosyltransferase family 4 protein n=1 Tax=Hydrogenophaga sp. SL48 TaxID=2806347 RepID=UPI001F1ED30B|nr:glycosyltransferase family 4 protein [Hydrogenophaga sp. SL48]UJW82789.1 glycosyltransferase [Hydrogenophaga sp. SL48]
MRVAYLISEYPKVSHSFIRREIAALERQGVEVLRFAIRGPSDGSPDSADVEELNRTRYVLGAGLAATAVHVLQALVRRPVAFGRAAFSALRLSRRADRGLVHHIAYFVEACIVGNWMEASKVPHLHAHFGSNPATVAMLAAQLNGCTFSFTAHGTVETDAAQFIGIPEKVRRAAHVVAVSEYGRSQLCRWVEPAHWKKISVVHCGLDEGYREAPALEFNPVRRFVCVGRLSSEKGQFVLIDALGELRRQGVEAELVLAGDGELRSAIERHCVQCGVADLVRITGWISGATVRKEIEASRALVLSSFAEGLPVVLMEAMACSRPVVATRVAGVPELVRDGEDGWLVAPGNAMELAAAMRRCLEAGVPQLQSMGQAARTRALDRHDVDRSAQQLKQIFEPFSGAKA